MDNSLKTWMFCQASYYLEYLQPEKSIALLNAVQAVDPKTPTFTACSAMPICRRDDLKNPYTPPIIF